MANPIVRALGFSYGGKKFAEANEQDFHISPGRTALFGDVGYFAHSQGAVRTAITVHYIVPVGGSTADKVIDTLQQKDVDVTIYNGTIAYTVQGMAIVDLQLRSNTETGRAEGTLQLEGGAPVQTGTISTLL